MPDISEWKGRHECADIWVIAAGPSAGYVEPQFFNNRISIGVNRVWVRFRTTYIVCKESQAVEMAAAAHPDIPVIASRYNCGKLGWQDNRPLAAVTFEHLDNRTEKEPDLDVIGTDKLVVSFSTITSAMHVAAYLGAANIFLVGHDCGTLDGQRNFPGYPAPMNGNPDFYRSFLGKIERQSLAVRERLEEVYGCRIYSLNPFLNFGLEGHEYEVTKSPFA